MSVRLPARLAALSRRDRDPTGATTRIQNDCYLWSMGASRTLLQQQISSAVWQVMARDGVAGLSLRRVAAVAGCTTGLLTHRFSHRRAMMLDARETLFKRMAARVAALGEDLSAHERLEEALSQSLTLDEERRDEARVWVGFLAETISDEELRSLHTRRNREWLTRVTALVAAVRAENDDRLAADPDGTDRDAAIALVALTDGLAALAVGDPTLYDGPTQRRILRDQLDRVIGPCPASRKSLV